MKTYTFKPILWRFAIWRLAPFFLGWEFGLVIFGRISDLSEQLPVLAGLIGASIISMIFLLSKMQDVSISSDGKINGPSTGILSREILQISDVDKATLYKQSFYEKISGFYSVKTRKGQKIIFVPFIYGKDSINELRKALEQH